MAPSRDTSTVDAYRRRVDQIRRQTAIHLGYESPQQVPPLALVEHLIGRKEASAELTALKASKGADPDKIKGLEKAAIARATWRQYKGSLLFVLERDRLAALDGVVIEELDLAIKTLRAESQSGCLRRSKKSSATKLKAFPDNDLKAVIDYLRAHIGEHRRANQLLTWLLAGRLVGARPSEWKSAGLITVDDVPAIRFGNAKATNGRGNGESRVLKLSGADAQDIEHVDDMLYMLNELEKEPGYDFDHNLELLGRYMRYVTRRALGKRSQYPTLYSLRHQLAADGKDSLPKANVAAIMGHGSDETAGTHYGRRAAAQRPVKVTPLDSEVASVRHRPRGSFRPRHHQNP